MHPMLNTAVKAARKAGAIINRASFDLDKLTVRSKRQNDFVSEVDHAAEEAILSTLREAYPDHGVLAVAPSALLVLMSVTGLRYDYAIPLPERDEDAANLLGVAVLANLVLSELQGRLKAAGLELEDSPISMAGARMSADLLEEGAISSKILKELYDHACEQKRTFPAIYEKEKPQQISDTGEIETMIDEVLAASPKQVEQYRAGKKTAAQFFVGQVMRASKGQANPQLVNELLAKKLQP